jgi:hypothetical protein
MSLKNVCVPLYAEPDEPLTGHTTAAVVGKTFANISADIQSGPGITAVALATAFDGGNISVATCAAKAKPIGVFAFDRAEGEPVTIYTSPNLVVPVTAGEAITAGEEVESDAGGKAIKLAAGKAAGKAYTTAASGKDCFVRLY